MTGKKATTHRKIPAVSEAPPPINPIRGGGKAMFSKRPDWSFWNKLPALSINECVMLLINVEPKTYLDRSKKQHYDRVYRLVQSFQAVGGLPSYDDNIAPSEFIAWAKTNDEELPDEWQPTSESTEIIERRSAEARIVEAGNTRATSAGSISFYPVAGGIKWVIGCSGSTKEVNQVKGFKEIALALRSPGENVLPAIAPHACTPTFSEQKTMDGRMADEISREFSDLTENIRIAREQGEHGELEKYEAELDRLNQLSPDSRERLNSGDAMISLTNSIRSRRTTAIRKIQKELGANIASQFEAYRVGNRHVTYFPTEPETKWILDPPKS